MAIVENCNRWVCWVLLAVCFGFAKNSHASTGQVCLVAVGDDIVVDGDLSEWGPELSRYPITHVEMGESLTSLTDGSASFVCCYSPASSLLFIGVEVVDDSEVESSSRRWQESDGCSLYIGSEAGDGVVSQFDLYGLPLAPEADAADRMVRSCWSQTGNIRTYEWSIDLSKFSPSEEIVPGKRLRFDLSICDKDADGSFSWISWGRGTRKVESLELLGEAVFLARGEKTASISGSVVGSDGVSVPRASVALRRKDRSEVLSLVSDAEGNFSAPLPVGHYLISSAWPSSPVVEVDLTTAGASVVVEMPRLLPEPKPLTVGESERAELQFLDETQSTLWSTHGLAGGEVNSVTQTRDGSIWMAGTFGILRYDGTELTTIGPCAGLPRRMLSEITADSRGLIWVGSAASLYCFDGHNTIEFTAANGLPPGMPTDLHLDSTGELWVACVGGLSRFDGRSFVEVLSLREEGRDAVAVLGDGATGSAWLGTTSGLARIENDQVKWYSKSEGLPSNHVTALEIDVDGILWVGTDHGLARFNAAEHSFTTWGVEQGLAHPSILDLEVVGSLLAIGTTESVELFDRESFRELLNVPSGKLFCDREGGLWYPASKGWALARLDRTAIHRTVYRAEGVRTHRLYQHRDGSLWAATDVGVMRLEPTGRAELLPFDLPSNIVWIIREDSMGNLWVGTEMGVACFARGDDGEFRFDNLLKERDFPSVSVIAMTEDRAGRFWLGTVQGIAIVDHGATSYLTTDHGLSGNVIASLFTDSRGRVWIGSPNGEVDCYENGRVQSKVVSDPAPPRGVHCFAENSEGELVSGGAEGLSTFDGTTWHPLLDVPGIVTGIEFDQRDRLWFSSFTGVGVYDGIAVQMVSQSDAKGPRKHNTFVIRNDAVICATDRGVVEYLMNETPPFVRVASVEADRHYREPSSVSFPSTTRQCVVHLHSTSHRTRSGAMQYRYRLVGYDDDWKLSRSPDLVFEHLPAGNYRFEAQAIDRDLNYSVDIARLDIDVCYDFGRLALWSGIGLVMLLCAWLAHAIYVQNRRSAEMNQELESRVTARTCELQDLQDKLLHSQKLEAIGTLSAGVAHDVNNSLAAILGFAQLASDGVVRGSAASRFLDQIIDACSQATGTTKGLLTFSGKSASTKEVRDLVAVVSDSMEFLHRLLPSSIAVQFTSDCEVAYCELDEISIRRVLLNLVVNARDAMPNGGEIIISMRTSADGLSVLLSCRDTGSGMTEVAKRRVFDPFFSTKERGRGTGLGMSIVHGFIRDHGGSIAVQSEFGVGTCFEIRFPLRLPPSVDLHVSQEGRLRGDRSGRVLVAEDNMAVRTVIASQLERAGYDVMSVEDGVEAIEVYERFEGEFEVLVLDVDLPHMDGMTCLRELRGIGSETPCVVMSGLPTIDPGEVEAVFIHKPFDLAQLLGAIDTARGCVATGKGRDRGSP